MVISSDHELRRWTCKVVDVDGIVTNNISIPLIGLMSFTETWICGDIGDIDIGGDILYSQTKKAEPIRLILRKQT